MKFRIIMIVVLIVVLGIVGLVLNGGNFRNDTSDGTVSGSRDAEAFRNLK